MDAGSEQTRVVKLVSRIDYLQREAVEDQERCVGHMYSYLRELQGTAEYLRRSGRGPLLRTLQARASAILDALTGAPIARAPAGGSVAGPSSSRLSSDIQQCLERLGADHFDAPGFLDFSLSTWTSREARLGFVGRYEEETGEDFQKVLTVACDGKPYATTILALFADPKVAVEGAVRCVYGKLSAGAIHYDDIDHLALLLVILVASQRINSSTGITEWWNDTGLPSFRELKRKLGKVGGWRSFLLSWMSHCRTEDSLPQEQRAGCLKSEEAVLSLLRLKSTRTMCEYLGLSGNGRLSPAQAKQTLSRLDTKINHMFEDHPLRIAFYASLSLDFGLVHALLQLVSEGEQESAGILLALLADETQLPLQPVASLSRGDRTLVRVAGRKEFGESAGAEDYLIGQLCQKLHPKSNSTELDKCILRLLGRPQQK